jgi:AraC family transcriptional regulator, positive regulator of tynA and feaB
VTRSPELPPTRTRAVASGSGHAELSRRWIDDLAVVEYRGQARERATGEWPGHVAVLVTSARPLDGDREVLLWPGAPAEGTGYWNPVQRRVLLLPRAALEQVSGRHWAASGVVLDGAAPAVRLLTDYLDALCDRLPALGGTARAAARNATLELFVGAVRPALLARVGAAPGPALRAVMETWIDRTLPGPVDERALAAAHGVSVHTVRRVFADGRPLDIELRLRRLARARAELAVHCEPIPVIARRWGFADSAEFIGEFRAHYGMSPGRYRAHLD